MSFTRLACIPPDAPCEHDRAYWPDHYTWVYFRHTCVEKCGEEGRVTFGNVLGANRGIGMCCTTVEVPLELWNTWVTATNELTRAVLQVRQKV